MKDTAKFPQSRLFYDGRLADRPSYYDWMKEKDRRSAHENSIREFMQLINLIVVNRLTIEYCSMQISDFNYVYTTCDTHSALSLLQNPIFMSDKFIMSGTLKAGNNQYVITIDYHYQWRLDHKSTSIRFDGRNISLHDGIYDWWKFFDTPAEAIERFAKSGSIDHYVDFGLKPKPKKKQPYSSIKGPDQITVSIDIDLSTMSKNMRTVSNTAFDDFDYSIYDDEMDKEREKWLY